jgi:hypothetical protein
LTRENISGVRELFSDNWEFRAATSPPCAKIADGVFGSQGVDRIGKTIRDGLTELASRHRQIGDVRGTRLYGEFRTPRRVIGAVELAKRYAENVSDVCLNVLPAGCEGTSSSSDGLVSFFRRSEKFLDFSGRPCGAEQISLYLIAAEAPEHIELLLGFDALRGGGHVAGDSYVHNGLHNGR